MDAAGIAGLPVRTSTQQNVSANKTKDETQAPQAEGGVAWRNKCLTQTEALRVVDGEGEHLLKDRLVVVPWKKDVVEAGVAGWEPRPVGAVFGDDEG